MVKVTLAIQDKAITCVSQVLDYQVKLEVTFVFLQCKQEKVAVFQNAKLWCTVHRIAYAKINPLFLGWSNSIKWSFDHFRPHVWSTLLHVCVGVV